METIVVTPNNLEECAVCFYPIITDKYVTDCSHTFHHTCIHEWSLHKPICPLCNFVINIPEFNIEIHTDDDITLPNVSHTITTSKHQTVINERIIGLHAIDGSCSNQVHFGAIDTYCTNGQITGEYDTVRKKNTSGFNIDTFIWELKNSKSNFDARQSYLQSMADTPLNVDGKTLLEKIIKSETLAKKMYELACVEISKRGKNVFALYSAFTNYASYADERNGFALRNTGKDTVAQSMWAREQKVSQWVSSPEFKSLMAA